MGIMDSIEAFVLGRVEKAVILIHEGEEKPNPPQNQPVQPKSRGGLGGTDIADASADTIKNAKSIAEKTKDELRSKADTLTSGLTGKQVGVKGAIQYNKQFEVQFNPSTLRISSQRYEEEDVTKVNATGGDTDISKGANYPYMELHVTLEFGRVESNEAFIRDSAFSNASTAMYSLYNSVVKEMVGKQAGLLDDRPVQTMIEAFTAAIRKENTREAAFCWGSMIYEGVIKNVRTNYTMFDLNGRPIRGQVALTLLLSDTEINSTNMGYWSEAYDAAFGFKEKGVFGKVKGAVDAVGSAIDTVSSVAASAAGTIQGALGLGLTVAGVAKALADDTEVESDEDKLKTQIQKKQDERKKRQERVVVSGSYNDNGLSLSSEKQAEYDKKREEERKKEQDKAKEAIDEAKKEAEKNKKTYYEVEAEEVERNKTGQDDEDEDEEENTDPQKPDDDEEEEEEEEEDNRTPAKKEYDEAGEAYDDALDEETKALNAVSDAKDEVEKQEKELEKKQAEEQKAKEDYFTARDAEDKAREASEAADEELEKAQDELDEAQDKLDKAQDKLDKAQEALDKEQEELDKAKEELKQVQDELSKMADDDPKKADAQKAVEAAQTKVSEAQTKVNEAQTKVNEAQTKADDAKTKADEAQTKVNDKTTAAKTAQNELAAKEKVTKEKQQKHIDTEHARLEQEVEVGKAKDDYDYAKYCYFASQRDCVAAKERYEAAEEAYKKEQADKPTPSINELINNSGTGGIPEI